MGRALGSTVVMAMCAILALAGTPLPAEAQTPCGGFHTIRSGDTLLAIAERCGVTVPALLAANPEVRANEDLAVGRRVAVPAPDDPEPTPQQACGSFYTIRTGDTLAEIARMCGLTVPLLMAANGPLPQPLGVHDGTVIRIPNLSPRAIRDTLTWAVPFDTVAAAPPAAAAVELTRVEGTLARGGRCMLLRVEGGAAIALDGRIGPAYAPGQRVVVMGLPVESARCGHDPTLELRIMHRPAGGR